MSVFVSLMLCSIVVILFVNNNQNDEIINQLKKLTEAAEKGRK